jgi:hypothetical protein
MTGVQAKLGPIEVSGLVGVLQVYWGLNPTMGGEPGQIPGIYNKTFEREDDARGQRMLGTARATCLNKSNINNRSRNSTHCQLQAGVSMSLNSVNLLISSNIFGKVNAWI